MSRKFLSPIKLAQGATNPSTGSAGELFFNTTDAKVYAHNGTAWVPSGGGVTVSATAPSSPTAGDAWYDTNDGTLFVYYVDATTNFVGTRTNLATNPNFESGATTGWTKLGNETLAIDTTTVYSGTKSLKVTTENGASSTGVVLPFTGVANATYTVSTKVWLPTGRTLTMRIMPPYSSSTSIVGNSAWQTVSTQVNMGSSTSSGINFFQGTGTTAYSFYVDEVLIEQTSSVLSYFDGSYAGATWSGTANLSSSSFTSTLAGQWVEVAANSGLSVNLSGRVGVLETSMTTAQSNISTLQTEVRSVPLGGTGASTLASGGYLKGTGTSAITSQSGIPAGDITSGVLAAARLPSTSIVQTVVGVYSGSESGNSTSTYADTNLTATITPTSSTSKILILISQALLRNSNTSVSVNYRLLRGATDLGNLGAGMLQLSSGSEWNGMQSFYYQDSPASTSALTYKTQFASGNNGPVVVANRGAAAYMILMEVKA